VKIKKSSRAGFAIPTTKIPGSPNRLCKNVRSP